MDEIMDLCRLLESVVNDLHVITKVTHLLKNFCKLRNNITVYFWNSKVSSVLTTRK